MKNSLGEEAQERLGEGRGGHRWRAQMIKPGLEVKRWGEKKWR